MRSVSDMGEAQIQRAIEQLYENERLTDALTDETAIILLNWGEQQLKSLATLNREHTDLESMVQQLHQIIRAINRLMEQRAELSEIEMIERLLKLVEQVMQFALQKSIAG